jgi:hypothetical protein
MRQVAEHVAPAFDEETVARETTRRSGPASADARPELEDEKTVEVVDTRRSSVAEAETAPLAASEERAPALHAVDVPEPPTEPATFRWSRPEDPRRARRRWAHVAVASLFVGAAVLAALFAQDASTSAHLESATDRETERAEQRPESAHAAPANSRATRVSDEAGEPGPAAEELGTIMVFDAAEADGDVLVSEPRPAPEAARAHRRDAVAQPPAGRTETGTLSVVAVPNAGVWLDGARIGETPLQSTVVVGRHRLWLETADGRRATRPVRVTPAETARVSVIFDP